MTCLILIGLATCMRAFTFSISTLFASSLFIGIGIALAGPLLSGFIKEKFLQNWLNDWHIFSRYGNWRFFKCRFNNPFTTCIKRSWNMALAFGVH